MIRTWPFVGRAAQLARVRRIRSGPGGRAGVVLVGPAGTGLTRLARAVLDAAAAEGWTARWAMATRSAAEIPLGALAQLLDAADPVEGPQVLPQAAAHIVAGAGGRNLVVGVNDAHLLDSVSASVLHHLAVTRSAFLVLTARTDVSVPDPVFALWKENLLERVDVHEFDEDETAELLSRVVEAQVDRATVHQLHALTGGNATYLRELVEDALRSRTLAPVDGIWRWAGPPRPTRRLSDLVRARIGSLRPEEQEVLELLAFGGDLDADGLLGLYGADLLDRLEQRDLLVSRVVGDRVRVSLARPLYVEVLRSASSPLRERAVYRRLAESLGGSGAESVDPVRTTSWRLAGGLPVPDETLVAVAEQAATAAEPDPAAAVRVARAAVRNGGGFDASMTLAHALMALGRPGEAEEVLAGLTAAADTDARRAGLAVARLGNLQWGVGDPDGAAELMAEVDRASWLDPRRPEPVVLRAASLAYTGHYGEALTAVAPLVDDADRLGPLAGPARAVAAEALCATGRHDAALAVAERARAALPDAAAWAAGWGRAQLDAASCGALIGLGRSPEAAELAEAGHRRAVAAHQSVAQALYEGWHGIALARQGLLGDALQRLRDAAGAVEGGSFPFLAVVLAHIAGTEAMRGDAVAGAVALRRAERASEAVGGAGDAWVVLASAWVAAAQGRGDAVTRALDAARRARAVAHVQAELEALHGCVRLGAATTTLDRITEVAAEVDGPMAPACARQAAALAAGDARRLVEVAEVFAGHGTLLVAAEVAAQAARLHDLGGRRGAARLAATRAREWAGRCQGAATPALASLGGAGVLTSRETEIATLAAAGMTSKAIAAELMVSVRTVDNVLHGIYRKLGVPGRRELGEALRAGVAE
ncbi:helix-turn-helix transcriptional regulator [Pseudonocardia yuanmonensis]|uniref:helix-turn-helix transcriptional regulator n=1 Tax=Pseudonocardia yuanmonensis TaxID=1095914 RepID=UPI0031EAD9F2